MDIFTHWLAVHDSRFGLEVSFKRLNHERIVCPPESLGDDPRTSTAYVLCQCQFGWEQSVWTGKHNGHRRCTTLVTSLRLHGHWTRSLHGMAMRAEPYRIRLWFC